MRDEKIINKMKFIFGSVFLTAQRWQNQGDKYLAPDNLTTKQWLLLAVISDLFPTPPTLSEAAKAIGSSRQNIKQIALKLQNHGFLRIEHDPKDNRTLRLVVTSKSKRFWADRTEKDTQYILELFASFSDEEVEAFFNIMQKLDKQYL